MPAGPSALEVVPALAVYIAWIAFTAVFFAIGMSVCAANAGPLAPDQKADARFRTELEGEAKFRETYKARFGGAEILYVALLNGAGGVLLWLALQGRLWAAGIFAALSLWMIWSHASAPATLKRMNPRLVGPFDRLYYFSGALVWIYLAACIALRWGPRA
jgi:hypothetical protein